MRYLFGPTTASFASEELGEFRASGECLAFSDKGRADGTDVRIKLEDSWCDVREQLPSGWQPDVIFLFLAYDEIPPCIWTQGIPIIGLMPDWNILWHERRRLFSFCDLLFTDRAGIASVRKAGGPETEYAFLFGLSPGVNVTAPDTFRDLDVVFAGNLNPNIQGERLPWLRRIAQLSDRWRIRIASHLPKPEYHRLLCRAKIVFNRSMRGEANARVAEAVTAGALLIQERNNLELAELLVPEADYATYDERDLENRITYFLTHDSERLDYCRAAQGKLQYLGWSHHWRKITSSVISRLQKLQDQAKSRLEAIAVGKANLVNKAPSHSTLEMLANVNEAGLTSVDAQALRMIGVCSAVGLEQPLPADAYPAKFGSFRTAWENASWQNGGRPDDEFNAKLRLIEAEAWLLLSEYTPSCSFLYEALARRRDFPAAHRKLGSFHISANEPALAVPHLYQAHHAYPFDAEIARLLGHTLANLGCRHQRDLLRESQRRLAQATPALLEREEWLFHCQPKVEELTSIIILCCGQEYLTRACIEGIRRNTELPFELVFVDNGSSDGTSEYLASLLEEMGSDRVQLIKNAQNRGFAAGVNQGLAVARGRFLALLNNDTIPQAGWLTRLLRCLVSQWPRLGACGPMSNAAPPPQQLFLTDSDRADLPAFATARRATHFGQASPVQRLSGFCLVILREAVAAAGPFDERFGLGFFEDDDYCLRIREAGFGLALVADAFVFHHGSQTVSALDVDRHRLLQENFLRFQEKWGQEHTMGYRLCPLETKPELDGDVAVPLAATTKVLPGPYDVTLTMIVKNEEKNLEACLAPVRGLFREIIVVDTGSTDGTRAIADRHATRVIEIPWEDSFANARNETLRLASQPWVFWLDADDRVDEKNKIHLSELFAGLASAPLSVFGVSMKCVCLTGGGGSETAVDHVRLFRLHSDVRWEYRVHEQILPSIRRLKGKVSFANHISVHHTGYCDPGLRSLKLDRDLRLLQLEDSERPGDPFTLFNLGAVCLEQGKLAESLVHLERSLARSHPTDSIVRKLYALIAQVLRALRRTSEALAACTNGRKHYPGDIEILFQEALVRRELGDLAGAKVCLESLLSPQSGNHFASVDTSLTGFKAFHNLAIVCNELGEVDRAEAAWRAAIASRPDHLDAQVGLAELFLSQGRWQEFNSVVDILGSTPHGLRFVNELKIRSNKVRDFANDSSANC